MQLTKHTDFAFRVLIYLASKPDEDLSQIQKIADDFAISRSHVMKVVQKLANHGFIASLRGQGGGLRLAKPATQINLREIVELMETTLNPVNCHQPSCLINTDCVLKTYLNQALEHYLAHLAQFYLSDLVTPEISQTLSLIKWR
ncbi:Rrf2 family transcriptional regulator [Thiomicrospira sp. R3]|uniref:RrF2 family transcriptional regulator n=1 Tax=Thiomicrospira sp. R3 TaxID=3035472 RepID=UPI00259AFD89|nr:Rrf2 family transcriptional regulator [Thiomicrospira sp. R3]WFE69199.1 Rrf2 family transcriptional regulator [Thiomicrospira sp. R3]